MDYWSEVFSIFYIGSIESVIDRISSFSSIVRGHGLIIVNSSSIKNY